MATWTAVAKAAAWAATSGPVVGLNVAMAVADRLGDALGFETDEAVRSGDSSASSGSG